MKKLISFLVLMALLCTGAWAEMEIQVIGGPEAGSDTVSLDDMQLGAKAEIDGWGEITLTTCKYIDWLHQFKQGMHTVAGNWNRFESGVEADYLLLQADVVNTSGTAKDYLATCEVKVIFDEEFEYAGWAWQYNWDNGTKDTEWDELNGIQNKEFVIDRADQFAIEPWYAGHYAFGCTLPNAIVESDKPLSLVITIDGNELTYNVR